MRRSEASLEVGAAVRLVVRVGQEGPADAGDVQNINATAAGGESFPSLMIFGCFFVNLLRISHCRYVFFLRIVKTFCDGT